MQEKSEKIKEKEMNGGEINKWNVIQCSKCSEHNSEALHGSMKKHSPTEGKLVFWLDGMWFNILQWHAVMCQSSMSYSDAAAFLQLSASMC